jgi:hypothetical protein
VEFMPPWAEDFTRKGRGNPYFRNPSKEMDTHHVVVRNYSNGLMFIG